MFKKIIGVLVGIAVLCGVSFTFTFAKEKLIYEKAVSLANQYIENSLEDELWKDNNPRISDSTYFYTDKEDKPSYIEFQVSCDNAEYCGFILVNIDGDDVAVPIASPSGIGPSKVLLAQLAVEKDKSNNGNSKVKEDKKEKIKKLENNTKLYYFSPFDQYIEDLETGEVVAMDPELDVNNRIEIYKTNERLKIKETQDIKEGKVKEKEEKLDLENLDVEKLFAKVEENNKKLEEIKDIKIDEKLVKEKEIELKEQLKAKLREDKQNSKEFKKSEKFKELKEGIKDQILQIPDEPFVMKNLNMANADYIYTATGASDVLVNGTLRNDSYCVGKTPCYDQVWLNTAYNNPTTGANESCYIGCTPTAVGIIFGYYANKGYKLFPSQVNNSSWTPGWNNTGTSNTANHNEINGVIHALGLIMGTTCHRDENGELDGGAGTPEDNVQLAKSYPKSSLFGYTNTTAYPTTGTGDTLFGVIKSEINGNRPLLLNIAKVGGAHSIVVFGYKSTPTNSNIVRVNFGWALTHIGGYFDAGNGSSYQVLYQTNIDQNLMAIYANSTGTDQYIAYNMTRFNIQ